MITYADLTAYERELINHIVPNFSYQVDYVEFSHPIASKIYSDCGELVSQQKINRRQLDRFANYTDQRIKDFFVENEFVCLYNERQYNRLPKGDELRRAGTIEAYYGAILAIKSEAEYLKTLDIMLKQQQARINKLELRYKPQNQKIARLSLVMSIISFLIAIAATGIAQKLYKYILNR